MKNCQHCKALVDDTAKTCSACGFPLQQIPDQADAYQPTPMGFDPYFTLGLVVPFLGLILYFVYGHHDPVKARRVLTGFFAQLSFSAAAVVIILLTLLA